MEAIQGMKLMEEVIQEMIILRINLHIAHIIEVHTIHRGDNSSNNSGVSSIERRMLEDGRLL